MISGHQWIIFLSTEIDYCHSDPCNNGLSVQNGEGYDCFCALGCDGIDFQQRLWVCKNDSLGLSIDIEIIYKEKYMILW